MSNVASGRRNNIYYFNNVGMSVKKIRLNVTRETIRYRVGIYCIVYISLYAYIGTRTWRRKTDVLLLWPKDRPSLS